MPNRPPREWWNRCIEGVESKSGGAVDPACVCGAVWFHKLSPEARYEIYKLAEKQKQKRAPRKR